MCTTPIQRAGQDVAPNLSHIIRYSQQGRVKEESKISSCHLDISFGVSNLKNLLDPGLNLVIGIFMLTQLLSVN